MERLSPAQRRAQPDTMLGRSEQRKYPREAMDMGKRARKKKARKGSSANHGKRPNS